MTEHAWEPPTTALVALLLTAATAAFAQNPQVRPPEPGTATGISGDSAASMPLPGRKGISDKMPAPAAGSDSAASQPDKGVHGRVKPYKPATNKRMPPDSGAEPSDPHQVNGRATGGPDNKASQPEPSGRGTGLAR